MWRPLSAVGCSVVLFLCAASRGELPASEYAVVNKVSLAGEGSWDYCTVDDSTGRLFVSHNMQVQVVDIAAGQQVGIIADTRGVHGIAIVRDLNKVYMSNGDDTSVTVADLRTLAFIGKIHVTGLDPDAIIYDPYSQSIVTCNGKTGNASVIDTKKDSVVATIVLGGKPEYATSGNDGRIYVNLEDKGAVAVINMNSMKVEKKWSVAPGSSPSAMAIDTADHRLFIGCRSKVMIVMDALNGKVIATLPIGEHVDAAAFDPVAQRVFCSNGVGTVTVIQKTGKNGFKVVENIATQKGAKTMALDRINHRLYLPTAEYEPLPAAAGENPKARAKIKPGSFMVLEVAPVEK
jgi:DNA-binding beta-propeller fold protein YncE